MRFAEKLKNLRKQAGMSQEKLAEKLNVSRQAVTKWETETGLPDIENVMAISAMFDISVDELLSDEKEIKVKDDYLFESVTEYDIDDRKDFDMKFGGAKRIVLSGYDGEKLRVRLVSNTLSTLQNDFKIRIDDIKSRIDIEARRRNGVTEAIAKEAVTAFIMIPEQYIRKIELEVIAQTVELYALKCDSIELDIKTQNLILENVIGTVEVNCNLDMNIFCGSLSGNICINQISSTSKISVPDGAVFSAVRKGIKTSISYEKNGNAAEAFDSPNADNTIELNGMKSELIISTYKKEV